MKVHIFGKKQVLYVVLAIILLCIGMVCALRAVNRLGAAEAAAGITDWGLSFQSEGAPPVANASQEYLRNFDALYVGDANQKEIYITFDAGFENGNTERILDALKKHGVKATFFLVGNYFETQPELVKRMAEEGHTIGNHTYSHPDMSKIGDIQSFQTELQKNEALYRDILGSEMPKLYRPPQGKFCEENLKMAQQLGYSTVFWSLAYADWDNAKQMPPERALDLILARTHSGCVALLHPTSATNAAILGDYIDALRADGYTFGSLTELAATPDNTGNSDNSENTENTEKGGDRHEAPEQTEHAKIH